MANLQIGAPNPPTYVAWDEANKLYVCVEMRGTTNQMYAVRLDFQGNQVGGGRYSNGLPSDITNPSQAEIVSIWDDGIDGQGHNIQFSARKTSCVAY